MRIVLVNAYGGDRFHGGAERYVRELRDGLTERGHEVAVLAAFPPRADDSPILRTLHDTDWQTSRLRGLRNHAEDWIGALPRKADPVLAELAPDLVHTNGLPGISTGIWELARRRAIPVVHTIHDYQLLCPRTSLTRRDGSACTPHPLLCGLRSRRLAHWLPGVRSVIGVSEHVLARHAGLLPAELPSRVVRPPRVPVPGAEGASAPERLHRVGYLGSLTAEKGVATLLAAVPALAQRGIECAIAGGGPLESEVRATAGVDYVGRLKGEAIGAFLRSCDVGLVTSLWEDPAPFAPLEWLAAGRPVIATGNGGLAELARAGGMRAYDGTAAGLLGAIDALQDRSAWEELVATIPPIDGHSDLTRWLEEHLDVYADADGAGRPLSAAA